jgi:hypothetical protein
MDAFYHVRTVWRCCFVMGVSVWAITACSSVGPVASSDQVNEGRVLASQSGAATGKFRAEIEDLVVMRLGDPDAVGKRLKTKLGLVNRGGAWVEWIADRGMLGSLEIRNIALRIDQEDASRTTLIFDVAPPGIELDHPLWEDAVPYPARPDASGSRPYWSAKVHGVQVYLGLDANYATLAQVTIVQP